jgi:lanosterol synthase
LRESQLRRDFSYGDRARWGRDRNRGGWCFSDELHGWPVSDCTAEALIAVLKLDHFISPEARIPKQHLIEAAEFILSRQNPDGGFGSFERRRGPGWLERFNPTEMFGNCMVEGSYLECTASCVNGLAHFRQRFPNDLRAEVDRAVQRGVSLLLRKQRPDGSWEGSWGVNFTYAILFCVDGLLATKLPLRHSALRRAGEWLLARQKPDGGWGEHWTSCRTGEYVEHPQSQVIMTAWAALALLKMKTNGAAPALHRAVQWLVSQQQSDGDFPERSPAGVFFKTGMLHYALYKNYFPLWMLRAYLAVNSESLG